MEQPQQQQQQADQESGNNNNNNSNNSNSNKSGGGGGYVCRQTSTRWTPTTDQIRILKDLYYNSGVRSPTADQIQKISARLRQYGKIEGKNVFYWFQNHKARERQKKRFNGTTPPTPTPTTTPTDHHHHHLLLHPHHHHHAIPMQRPSSGFHHNSDSKLDQDHLFHNRSYPNGNLYHATSGGTGSPMNPSNGYMSSSHGYGSMDCSISPTGGSSGGNNMGYNFINMDHHHYNYSSPPYNFFNRPKSSLFCPGQGDDDDDQDEDEQDDDEDHHQHHQAYLQSRRTLPLFPMHGEDHINGGGFWKPGQSDGDHRGHVGRGPYASLELSLGSFTAVPPD